MLCMSDRFCFDNAVTLSNNSQTHCKVKTCTDIVHKIACVCKIYKIELLKSQKRYSNEGGRLKAISAADDVLNEVALLSDLSHTNIVPLICTEEVNGKLKLYFPYYGSPLMTPQEGLLYTSLAPNLVSPDMLVRLAKHISAALQYIHGLNICHRDVKPDNIFMSHGGIFLLSDFGSARKYSGVTSESPATIGFFPPEVCGEEPTEHDPQKADLWALGITVLCCAIGRLPYAIDDADDVIALLQAIAMRDMIEEHVTRLTAEVRNFTKILLSKTPSDRIYLV